MVWQYIFTMALLLEIQSSVDWNLIFRTAFLSCCYILLFLVAQSEYYPSFLDLLSLQHSGGINPLHGSRSAPPVNPNVLFFNVHGAFTLASNGKLCWSFHQVVLRRCCAPEENNPLWSQHLCSRSPAPSHGSSQIRSARAANRDGMFSLFTHQGFLLAWKDCLLIFNFILWKASVK